MLAGNQLKKDSKRMIWKESDETKQEEILSRIETAIDLEKVLMNSIVKQLLYLLTAVCNIPILAI